MLLFWTTDKSICNYSGWFQLSSPPLFWVSVCFLFLCRGKVPVARVSWSWWKRFRRSSAVLLVLGVPGEGSGLLWTPDKLAFLLLEKPAAWGRATNFRESRELVWPLECKVCQPCTKQVCPGQPALRWLTCTLRCLTTTGVCVVLSSGSLSFFYLVELVVKISKKFLNPLLGLYFLGSGISSL